MDLHLKGTLKLIPNLILSSLIGLPFVFIKPRLRFLALIPIWLVTIFILTNLWYFRFCEDFIPLKNYFLFENYGFDLFGAGVEMIKPKDIVIAIPALLMTFAYIFHVFSSAKGIVFGRKAKWIISISTLLLFSGNEVVRANNENKANGSLRLIGQWIVFHRYNPNKIDFAPWVDYNLTDFGSYIFRNSLHPIAKLFVKHTPLTESERKILDGYESLHQKLSLATPDIDFHKNKDKNLIFIIVESLDAWAVDAEVNGNKVMPNLSNLMVAEGTISSKEMLTQIHNGISSDGQFLYNTGMYPSSKETTVYEYLDNDLPSLAKNVFNDRPSFEVICEGPAMWRHEDSNKSYGYRYFFYNTDRLAKKQKIGRDAAMFHTALDIIDTIPKPFFGMLITMTMHGPFQDAGIDRLDWIWEKNNRSELMNRYLQSCHYFDECLASFIDGLKQRNLYDNSLIVIASDHTAWIDDKTDERIVLSILNSGETKCITHPIGQVDVYPTILQVMDRYDAYSYTGMGLSVLNPMLAGAIDRRGCIHYSEKDTPLDSMLQIAQHTANLYLQDNSYPFKPSAKNILSE